MVWYGKDRNKDRKTRGGWMIPEVTVIIPTIHSTTVFRALDSIAAQSAAGTLEVFVIRDGQTPYAREDFARYPFAVHSIGLLPNQGAAAARNVGIHYAQGPFIAFLDDDDEWLPNHLLTTLTALQSHAGIVFTDAELYHLEEGWHRPFRFAYQPSMLTQTSPVIPSTLVVSREVFDQVGYFDTHIPAYSDWDWILRASRLGAPIARIPAITANYYYSSLSTSSHPETMAPQLRLLRQKHRLGPVPVASFAQMMTDPWFSRWRAPG